jgi:hypothetical protein
MPIATVKQLCAPSAIVSSDSLVEQVAQIEDFAAGRVDGRGFFRRNYFTAGLDLLVRRGFDRLSGKSEDGAFYLTQAMGGGKTHSLIAFGLLAADPALRREVPTMIAIRGFAMPNSLSRKSLSVPYRPAGSRGAGCLRLFELPRPAFARKAKK